MLTVASRQGQSAIKTSVEPERKIEVHGSIVSSVGRMKEIAADPRNAGRTFQVAADVFEFFLRQLIILPRAEGDIQRINMLLGTHFDETYPGGLTRSCRCQHCGHQYSYADHVESALEMGVHSQAQLRDLFSGHRYFLTVDTDKPRQVLCISCKRVSGMTHCCYATSSYGYAAPPGGGPDDY